MTVKKLPRTITHRELERGDIVDLEFASGGWGLCKVTGLTDMQATLFRPHMHASGDGYPRIDVEVFTVWRDSDKTVRLIERDGL